MNIDIEAIDTALADVIANANAYRHKTPDMVTLAEEVSEANLASRGKHEHPLRYELMQLAGVCINIMRAIDADPAGFQPWRGRDKED